MGHSQSANVIVDVENHHHDNSGANVCQQTKLPLGDGTSMTGNAYNNGRSGNNVVASNNVVSTGNVCQGQGMQGMNEHCVQTIPIKNRNNTNSYNAIGMMTLPKGGQQQQQQHLSASINYGGGGRGDCATLPRNMSSANAIAGINLGNFPIIFHFLFLFCLMFESPFCSFAWDALAHACTAAPGTGRCHINQSFTKENKCSFASVRSDVPYTSTTALYACERNEWMCIPGVERNIRFNLAYDNHFVRIVQGVVRCWVNQTLHFLLREKCTLDRCLRIFRI